MSDEITIERHAEITKQLNEKIAQLEAQVSSLFAMNGQLEVERDAYRDKQNDLQRQLMILPKDKKGNILFPDDVIFYADPETNTLQEICLGSEYTKSYRRGVQKFPSFVPEHQCYMNRNDATAELKEMEDSDV